MNNNLEYVLEIRDRLASIEARLAQYNTLLEQHIRRTELLESDVAPIKRHIYMLQGGAALIGLLALLAAIFEVLK